MRFPCLQRLAKARRLFVSLVSLSFVVSAASAATITGHVTDPDGRDVPAARIVIATSIGTAAEGVTDAAGRFVIDTLPAGRYDVIVVATGLAADPMTIALSRDESRDVTLMLHLSPITESILVSAAQVDVPLSRTADTVMVITAADLQASQIETVGDALRFVPGLSVTRSGGRGAVTSLFPRGGDPKYTLVLIDGIRANDFVQGGYDFGHLTVSDIDRIEVVRGPQSALFGSEATGAVVQIITRRGGAPRLNAFIEGGNEKTSREAVDAAGSHGLWSWGGGAESARSDGFTGIAPASGETVSNDDDHLWRVSGSLGWQRPAGADLLVTGRINRDERGFPGPYGSDPIGAFPGVDRVSRGVNNTRQVGSRFSHSWSPRLRQRLEADYMDLSSDFASPFGPSTSSTRRFEGRVQEDLVLSSILSASGGVAFLREHGDSSFITGASGDAIPIERSQTGLFAELRYAGNERLSITGGVRLEHLSRDSLEAGPFSSRPAFPTQTINSFNPKVAVSYLAVGTSTRVHASAGTGIRPPDAFEIAFTDNPDLKPERSRSLDAGVEQRLAGGLLVVAATAFFNSYDDLLITVGKSLQDASQFKTDNISNARARGLELSADGRLGPSITVHATYTFLASEVLSVDGLDHVAPPPFKVGDPLLRRPRHQGSVGVTYAIGRLTTFGEVSARGETLDVEPNFGAFGGLFPSAGYAVVNLGASARVVPLLEVYGRVLNVGDRSYEEALGYPALGRSVIMGLRIAAGR
jgi:outer membrane cobalamin receptor